MATAIKEVRETREGAWTLEDRGYDSDTHARLDAPTRYGVTRSQ